MVIITPESIKHFQKLMEQEEQVNHNLGVAFQNLHHGHPVETLLRFLNGRDGNVTKAHKMITDCLNWRIENDIDTILSKPIVPSDFYRAVRDSQLVGLSGYTKEGRPVIAVGVGMSTFDKASINYYIQSHIQINEYRDRVIMESARKKFGQPISTCVKILDMSGLKFSALSQLKLQTAISTIDDLNYPEKTDTYYIVNAPYIFSACWKVVRPLLHERTRNRVQVLPGCGKEELLKIMDNESLPHFCKTEGSGPSENCFSFDHPFHQQLYSYVKQQADSTSLEKEGSVHVAFPEADLEDKKIAETITSEFHRIEDQQTR